MTRAVHGHILARSRPPSGITAPWLHSTIAAKGLVYGNNEAMRVGLHQRRGADVAGSASNFLMILLGSTPMA